MLKIRLLLAALALALVAGACGGDGDDTAETSTTTVAKGPNFGAAATVEMKNLQFVPKEISVKAGDEVLWKFEEAVAHNVVHEDFESETKTGGEFRHTFEKSGEYKYRCTVHPGMEGVVKVTG